jgi:predicted O-methyltransferase YrrM
MEHYYNKINTHMFTFPALYKKAVAECPDGGKMIEIGSWVGESLAYLAVEAINSGKKLDIYAVDAFIGNVHSGETAGGYPQWDMFKRNMYPVWDSITPVKGISWEVADQFEDASIDFIFIDADHTYEGVMKDIKSYWPKMKSGGLFAGHDYVHPPVRQAIDDFTKELGLTYESGENSWWLIKE